MTYKNGAFGRMLVAVITSLLCSTASHGFDYFQALPSQPMIPKNNPQSEAKIILGKKLFYDRNLSKRRSHSCNDCHNLLTGGDDDRAFSTGANGKPTKRSAPPLWNIGLQTVLYWDGRVATLEQLMEDHFTDKSIMAMANRDAVVKRIKIDNSYDSLFKHAFDNDKNINFDNTAQALSSFLRALMAPNSPFDRYINGDKTALSKTAIKGIEVFTESGCLACHFGTNFAGPAPGPAMTMGDGFYELFPNHLGSKYDQLYDLTSDLGRYEFSKQTDEKYMWRVPPLRNIAISAPYFHNGSAKTLRDAVRVMAIAQFKKELTETEIDAIVAFLNSLTGETPAVLRMK